MACAAALWLREAPRYRARVVRQVCATTAGRALPKCSSAVHCAVSAGLKRFGALRAIVETRERFFCCRVADARSNKAGLSTCGKLRIRESQARRRVEAELEKCPQDCSRSSHRLLAVGISKIARGPKAGEAALRIVQAQRCTGGEDWSATVPISTRVQRNAAFSRN